jgi:hypothetical protein
MIDSTLFRFNVGDYVHVGGSFQQSRIRDRQLRNDRPYYEVFDISEGRCRIKTGNVRLVREEAVRKYIEKQDLDVASLCEHRWLGLSESTNQCEKCGLTWYVKPLPLFGMSHPLEQGEYGVVGDQ